jgi:hypothetical protein
MALILERLLPTRVETGKVKDLRRIVGYKTVNYKFEKYFIIDSPV